jgi:hypothetical protein
LSKHFQIFNRKIVERDTPNKQIHDRSSSWLGTGTSIKKNDGVNLPLWAHPPPPPPLLCLSHIIRHVSVFYKKASEIKHVNFIVDILVYDELKNVVQNLLLLRQVFCICIINDCPKPVYRLPYIAPLDLYRMGVFFEVRVILIVFPKYISLNLKSVTVGKIWLQKIQINHEN